MPGAQWSPVANYSPGGVDRPPRGQVVHTAVTPATLEALGGVVRYMSVAAAQVSSYFVVGIDGTTVQCVDLDNRAWTQAAGNRAWVGVENIGDGTKEPLTPAQVQANARILAWLHDTYGVPLERTDDPAGHGLGWHGMGGQAWGGHLICPGSFIRAQLPDIVTAAVALVNPTPPPPPTIRPEDDTMYLFQEKGSAAVSLTPCGARGYAHVDSPEHLATHRQILGALNPTNPFANAIFPVAPGWAASLAAGAAGTALAPEQVQAHALGLLSELGPPIVKTLAADAPDTPIIEPEPYEG